MGFRISQLRSPSQIRGQQAQSGGNSRAVFRNPSGAQLGSGIVRGAQALTSGINEAARREELARKQRNDFLTALTENKLDTLRVEAQNKISSLQGANALEASPDIKRDYLQNVTQLIGELPEDLQASPDMQIRLAKSAGDLERFSIGHTYKETNKLKKEAFDARVANDINSFSENSYDMNYLKGEGLRKLQESIITKARNEYGDNEEGRLLAQKELEVGVSQAVKQAVRMQLASNNFDMAGQTIEGFYDQITEDDKIELAKIMKTARADRADSMALELSDEAFATVGDNISAQEKYIREMAQGDDDLYRKSMNFVQTRSRIQKEAKSQEQEKLEVDVYNDYITTGQMPMGKYLALEPERRDKIQSLLEKHGGRLPRVSDAGALDSAIAQLSTLPDEQLVEYDVRKNLQSRLSEKDLQKVESLKQQAQKRVQGKYNQAQKFDNVVYKRVYSLFNKTLGLSKKDSKKNEEFQRLLSQRYMEIIDLYPNKDKVEQEKMLIRDIQERIKVEKKSFLGIDRLAADELNYEDFLDDLDPKLFRQINAAQRLLGRPEMTPAQAKEFLRSTGRLPK